MKVQHRQRLEITLDIFRGCSHACSGCMIDKAMGGDVNDIPELHALIREMVDVGYVAFDLGIGPTDFMSSENVDEVLEHPEVRDMAMYLPLTHFTTGSGRIYPPAYIFCGVQVIPSAE